MWTPSPTSSEADSRAFRPLERVVHPDGTDASVCRAIVHRHARTFSWAGRFLDPTRRRGACAVYAVCRMADDIVDIEGESSRVRLAAFQREVLDALKTPSASPVLREFAWATHRFGIPLSALEELFHGVGSDLTPTVPDGWPALLDYCEGVAGSVGEMIATIFGFHPEADRTSVTGKARLLGVAMQLTNILRDVGEDARRGRCYLPVDELARFGLDVSSVMRFDVRDRWESWQAFMAFQVDRARSLYRQSVEGIRWLQPDSRRCAIACADGYAGILRAIERAEYDTLSARVAVTRADRLRVAWNAIRLRRPLLSTQGAAQPQLHMAGP